MALRMERTRSRHSSDGEASALALLSEAMLDAQPQRTNRSEINNEGQKQSKKAENGNEAAEQNVEGQSSAISVEDTGSASDAAPVVRRPRKDSNREGLLETYVNQDLSRHLKEVAGLGEFELQFTNDREVYYDLDTVSGTLTIRARGDIVLKNMRAVLVCDISYKDALGLLWTDRVARLKSSMDLPGDRIRAGEELKVPFSVDMPEKQPASFAVSVPEVRGTAHRGVFWSIRIAADDEAGESHVLAARNFFKSEYFENALHPRGRAERRLALGSAERKVTLSAELGKNVYQFGEPIDVHVHIMNDTVVSVKSVRAQVTQKLKFAVPQKDINNIKKQVIAEEIDETPIAKGDEAERSFSLVPEVPEKCKYVCVRSVFGKPQQDDGQINDPTPGTQLAPSMVFNDPRTNRPESMRVEFAVAYAVKITADQGMGRTLILKLPVTLCDAASHVEGVTPIPHRVPEYRTQTRKSLFSLSVTHIDALPSYGTEDDVLAEKLRQEQIARDKEIARRHSSGVVTAVTGLSSTALSKTKNLVGGSKQKPDKLVLQDGEAAALENPPPPSQP